MRPVLVAVALVVAALAGCASSPAPAPAHPLPDPLAVARPADLEARGRGFAAQGDHVRAEQYLAAALERGAPAARILPALVKVAIAGKRYRLALRHAEALARLPGSDWTATYLVATLRAGTGDAVGARRVLLDLVDDQPAAAAPRYLYATLLIAEGGRTKEVRRLMRAYLELEPEGDHSTEARRWLRHGGR